MLDELSLYVPSFVEVQLEVDHGGVDTVMT